MKNIQYISFRLDQKGFDDCSEIKNPKALDSYLINIIDLTNPELWYCPSINGVSSPSINGGKDLQILKDMIDNSQKSKQVVLLPNDIIIQFNKYGGYYNGSEELKKCLTFLSSVLRDYLGVGSLSIGFEPNKTIINGKELESDFYFKGKDDAAITKAKDTNKTTTIQWQGLFLTFLHFNTEDDIKDLLFQIGLISEHSDYPQWLDDYYFDNDEKLNEEIATSKNEILSLEEKIANANAKKKDNLYYKSMLFETGDVLVEIVFKVFKEMLNENLSNFIDEKKEDFLFKHDGITYIGEIKGVNDGVGSAHISQVDNHKDLYEDKLQKENKMENIKKLLIINDQRKKPINERQPIHQNQIEKAIRYDTLIIRTIDLLKILELFRQNKLNRETIFDYLRNQAGQIKY